jgi:hypothetical protein
MNVAIYSKKSLYLQQALINDNIPVILPNIPWDFQRINYSKKNKRQVFSRMIIILRGGEKGLPSATPFLPLIYA